jgi:4-amino-4-deoxychorismate lyase
VKLHSRLIFNDRLTDARRARALAVSATTLYGRGVFTTLAVYNYQPFLWREHYRRLIAHAQVINVDASPLGDEDFFRAQLQRIIEANKVEDGRVRVSLMAREAGGAWETTKPSEVDSAASSDLLIITGDARHAKDDELNLTVSPYRSNTFSPLAGIKSVNYLEHLSQWEEARRRDFDEAIVMNERGEIVSAAMANIFWATRGTLYTPALSTGALDGTTRACVINLASDLSVPVVEGVYDLSHLSDADEIFLTSAGLGVRLATTFDFHRYTVAAGSIVVRIREVFRQLTLQSG